MCTKDTINELKPKVEKYLSLALQTINELETIPYGKNLLDGLNDFIKRGGKRLRPILFIVGYKAVKKTPTEDVFKASITTELMHNFMLIHDDIIDRDETRRGGPTFHKLASNWLQDNHYGIAFGIMAGDILNTLAVWNVLNINIDDETKIKILKELINAEIKCLYGEFFDTVLAKMDSFEEEDIMRVMELKTASYTVEAPLVSGAIMGKGTSQEIQGLREYGKALGKAFQIQDDILGMFGEYKKLGKPVDSDLKEGKKTLLIFYAIKLASDSDKKFILQKMGNENVSDSDIARVRKIIKDCGALKKTGEVAKSFAEEAKAAITGISYDEHAKKFLYKLADYVIAREL